jgi:hypothetical protein
MAQQQHSTKTKGYILIGKMFSVVSSNVGKMFSVVFLLMKLIYEQTTNQMQCNQAVNYITFLTSNGFNIIL